MGAIDTIGRAKLSSFQQSAAQSRSSHGKRFTRIVQSLSRAFHHFLERRRSRLALLEMTDEQLKDIGISRRDADHEGRRPFWD